jgi:hypothetical protein
LQLPRKLVVHAALVREATNKLVANANIPHKADEPMFVRQRVAAQLGDSGLSYGVV